MREPLTAKSLDTFIRAVWFKLAGCWNYFLPSKMKFIGIRL